ncbi:dipeptidyl peptidase 3 isoform X1 [Ooceraea biroi]|uniref:Dipeptidyl peptidase 3 n=2 Tax=Ooceraea biroi TaxID=2015173 RepID=A0A026WW00_OOCBI|nr:dipeptidyl peptidase 3 isoform X1 [Ooceraea biroi]EZA60250.1 Dipeptidyl peptidase [Ooceraea biroi]
MLKTQALHTFRLIGSTSYKRLYFSLPYATKVVRTANRVAAVHTNTQIDNPSGKLYSCFRQTYSTMSIDTTLYTLPNNQPVVALECENAFKSLTQKEKLYAHYLSQASWNGGLIVLIQTSPESPLIFALLHKIYLAEPIDELKDAAMRANVTDDDFTAFLVYSCGVFANAGNYKAMGDTKIIPNLPKNAFETIVKASKAYRDNSTEVQNIWNNISNVLYSLDGKLQSLGLGDRGVTTYFSANCTKEDADKVNAFMEHKGLESYNARCFKTTIRDSNGGVDVYEIKLASVETSDDPKITLSEETYRNARFKITRGDYSELMVRVVENLKKAKAYASNQTEKDMLDKYIDHFQTGSLDDHRDGSRLWIKDKGPAIETYIGFIETYRDPAGQRGEFEGFVAMVNREMSEKFATLVNRAEEFIPKLPWNNDFEKDTFLRPDFTSLDVLTFAGSCIPSGINIPNYDEIRQSEGFKNVSLGNVIPAHMKDTRAIPFLSEADQALMHKYRIPSFEVQVGLHELLGHGTGKYFKQTGPDSFNFDRDVVKNPLNGGKIDKFFLKGETYDSKFGPMGSSYEECRAEAVGLYLSLEREVLSIFGHEGSIAEDIIYVNWLSLLWSGFAKAFEMYQPSTGTWSQAHAQARYVLLRVCLEAGDGFVNVVETEDGKNLEMSVDRRKIFTTGKKAIGDFLLKLQVYKSMGDVESAKEMYDRYSAVPESGPHPWARWRDIILSRKEPRKIFVQSNTFIDGFDPNNVVLKNYESSFTGFIQSWIERFPNLDISQTLIALWNKDKKHFPLANN